MKLIIILQEKLVNPIPVKIHKIKKVFFSVSRDTETKLFQSKHKNY